MKTLFVDINVAIDFLTRRKPHCDHAEELFQMSAEGKVSLFISANAISTIYYIIKKLSNHNKALESIRSIKKYLSIADTNEDIINDALNSLFKNFEDAIQHFSTINANCDAIVTRNKDDFKQSELPVFDAKTILPFLHI